MLLRALAGECGHDLGRSRFQAWGLL